MTSNRTQGEGPGLFDPASYLVYGCLSASRDEPRLQAHFEERAGSLVRELSLAMATASVSILEPEAFRAFFAARGVELDALSSGLGARRLSGLMAANGHDEARLAESLGAWLVEDFNLLSSWIEATKGRAYLDLLFGSCHPVPFFDGESFCMKAAEYLAAYAEDFPQPFSGLLVDEGTMLRISRPGSDAASLRRIIAAYPSYNLWILSFWA